MPVDGTNPFSVLETTPEIFGYAIELTRAEGGNEVEFAKAVAIGLNLHREELRHTRDVLKRLGYHAVARMLTQLARKARRSPPAPRPRWPGYQTNSALIYVARRRAERAEAERQEPVYRS